LRLQWSGVTEEDNEKVQSTTEITVVWSD
jgi:hypothetical protein